jgi:hypothetical protein
MVYVFQSSAIYKYCKGNVKKRIVNADNITTVKWSVKTLFIFVLYRFSLVLNFNYIHSNDIIVFTVHCAIQLKYVLSLYIMQILFVLEMVNNFYYFVLFDWKKRLLFYKELFTKNFKNPILGFTATVLHI